MLAAVEHVISETSKYQLNKSEIKLYAAKVNFWPRSA
jgi:hypothetical protein